MTEGKATEPQYLERLWQLDQFHGTVPKIVGVGKDPEAVVRRCIDVRERAAKEGEPFQLSVCLVDVDDHASLKPACALASKSDIHLLVSNLKFEVWLRWHVDQGRSRLNSGELDTLLAKRGLIAGKHLTRVFPFDQFGHACDVARAADPGMAPGRVGPNPSTPLPLLIEWMQGRLP